MNPDRWALIKPVFDAAAEQPAQTRAAFIRSSCDGDKLLAAEIESLLAAHDQADSFIETPAQIDPEGIPQSEQVLGKLIGPYRVVREVGAGGMGSVYVAARADESFEKEVAIKLIRSGLGADFIVKRFVAERQILARLEHPNIARLIDGGTTEEGLPYLVMEYVEGEPITAHCQTRDASIRERLELFRQVCDAVHYAHQHLIVHRDIKPGNILVTPDGKPKLLDFGIAKLLSPDLDAASDTTGVGQVMTPDYASPEQAKGEPITTASDVYSLGVLLYELLSGSRPYHITSSSPLEIARVICENEPSKPSTAAERAQATAPAGGDTAAPPSESLRRSGNLRRQLEGDLDNIVMKAMRKEPRNRYGSAQELSDDIRRHLEGQPVAARPATFGYRAGKLIRRQKTAVVSAGVILLLIIGGVAGIARQTVIAQRQRARAEKRFNEVRKLANSFMFEFHDAIMNLPGATRARQLVVNESLEYLNSLADESTGDPSLQSELAFAYSRLGTIQETSMAGNLGDRKGAIESQQKALALRQSVVAAIPHDTQALVDLAWGHTRLGQLEPDNQTAIDYHRKALEVCESVLQSHPDFVPAQRAQALMHGSIAQKLSRNDAPAAMEYYRKAIAESEAFLAVNTGDAEFRRNLSVIYKSAGAQVHLAHDREAALGMYRKAMAIDEADFAAEPNNTEVKMALSFSYGSIGSVMDSAEDYTGALVNYRKALDLRLSVASADPSNAFALDTVARAHERIGRILWEVGDHTAAEETFRKFVAVHESSHNVSAQASDCSRTGDFLTKFADDPSRTLKDRNSSLREALYWYRKSLELQTHNANQASAAETKERERIASQISHCEEALRKPG